MTVTYDIKWYLEWLEEMAMETGFDWSIAYDTDYGDEHKAGYSVTITGIVCVEFAPTMLEALEKANDWYADAQSVRWDY